MPWRIISAAFSAIMMIGAFVFIWAVLGPAKKEAPRHIERVPEVAAGETV